jgi:hypothetical protein
MLAGPAAVPAPTRRKRTQALTNSASCTDHGIVALVLGQLRMPLHSDNCFTDRGIVASHEELEEWRRRRGEFRLRALRNPPPSSVYVGRTGCGTSTSQKRKRTQPEALTTAHPGQTMASWPPMPGVADGFWAARGGSAAHHASLPLFWGSRRPAAPASERRRASSLPLSWWLAALFVRLRRPPRAARPYFLSSESSASAPPRLLVADARCDLGGL